VVGIPLYETAAQVVISEAPEATAAIEPAATAGGPQFELDPVVHASALR
jgi:hypothetical protein